MGMNEEEARLRGLIEHWASHNDEHRDRFLEAAKEAEELGLREAWIRIRFRHFVYPLPNISRVVLVFP
jgi:alkanesulfonate monooxygenase SsuD/methylene tetrahydromethanopterin reductase-like flavin-dependent oxidoreductase (luciferase family)